MDYIDYREKLGLSLCDKETFKYFKVKILNVLKMVQNSPESEGIDFDEYFSFCNLTGTALDQYLTGDYHAADRLGQCLSVLEKAETLVDFLACYVAFINSVKPKRCGRWSRKGFVSLVENMMAEAHISYEMLEKDEEYFIFPKGAEELDEALVSQPLEWLKDYPNAHKTYCTALKQYSDNIYIRDVADNFRKALEEFFQEFLDNNKNLANNKTEIFNYLKEHNAEPKISSMFQALINSYDTLNNEMAKHNDKVDEKYLEFLMYQTGIFIRLLIIVKKSEVTE